MDKAKTMYVTSNEFKALRELDKRMQRLYDTELEKLFGEDAKHIHPKQTELKIVNKFTKRFD